MCFFIGDDELLEKFNGIWNKVNYSIKKELDYETIYNKRFLKTEIRISGHKDTDFPDKEIPKKYSIYTCLTVMLIDFVFKIK